MDLSNKHEVSMLIYA